MGIEAWWAGLIVAALILFFLETQMPGMGIFGLSGAVCLVLGAFMLSSGNVAVVGGAAIVLSGNRSIDYQGDVRCA